MIHGNLAASCLPSFLFVHNSFLRSFRYVQVHARSASTGCCSELDIFRYLTEGFFGRVLTSTVVNG